MFWAALAAQQAGETHVTADRIAASLLRTDAVRELCSAIGVDLGGEPLEVPSREQETSLELRPLDPAVKPVFDAILERHGRLAVPPLALLLDLIRADPALAERLAPHGLTVTTLGAALK